MSLSVSAEGNPAAKRLYERLGYRDAGVDPVRVLGVITLRGEPFEVDDTLVYLQKPL
jgi:RimJ/RimL family protein N-acetyltransferase